MWNLCRYIQHRMLEIINKNFIYDQLASVCCANNQVVRYPTDKEIIDAIKLALKIE